MKIALFIDSLRMGGAQWQFVQLADGLAKRGHQVTFVTLHGGGPYWDWLDERQRARLHCLNEERGGTVIHRVRQMLTAPARLATLLRDLDADVVYSALHTSDVIAWRAAALAGNIPVAWSLRTSKQTVPWKQRVSVELCRLASSRVPLMLANSEAGLKDYERRGFKPRRTAVVPNGIDVDLFHPDDQAGQAVRREWGIAADEILIGIVGRLMPVKDHPLFLDAAARLAADVPVARFVCIGDGPDAYTNTLLAQALRLGLRDKVIFAGGRRDMPVVYNALDLLCLSSRSEGFPNVVAEAMASGVPPVATRVGDVAMMMGETGRLVSPSTPDAMAAALAELTSLPAAARRELGLKARARIVDNFSVEVMVQRTERYLEELRQGVGPGQTRLAA